MALKDTDFMYSSAVIRSKEGTITFNEKINSYLNSKNISELLDAVFPNSEIDTQTFSFDDETEKIIEDAAELIKKLSPEKEVFDFLFYEYDCCNIKTIIKCNQRNIPFDNMLFRFGTVCTDVLEECFKERKYDRLPKNMSLAIEEAIKTYSQTNDPKYIDFIIDKACFEDMKENISKSKVGLFRELVKSKADFTNILSFERINRSEIADKKGVFSNAFVCGGEVPLKDFVLYYDGKVNGLGDVLFGTKYKEIVVKAGDDFDLSEIELPFDQMYLSIIKNVKFIPFGAEVLCSYFLNKVYEVKNIRVIYTGLKTGTTKEEMRKRVRLYE